MSFYFGIFGVLAFFSLIELFRLKEKQRNQLFILFSLFFFILSFIRWEIGTDWGTYYDFFQRSTEWGHESEFEWGFSRINEFVQILFGDYTVLLFILGAILFSFQTSAIYKLSPYPITSLLFLWSVLYGNAMFIRQSISTVILLFSVIYIIRRRFWPFFLCVVLAMLFHRSSFIFLPAWWLYKIRIRPLWLWVGVCLSVLSTSVIKNIIETMSGAFGPIIQAKIDMYFSDSETTFGTAASLVQIIVKGVLNKLIVFFFLILMLKRVSRKFPQYQGLVNLYWFGVLIYFATIGISLAMVRFSFAYDILQIILVPMLFTCLPEPKNRTLWFVVFLLYLFARLYVSLVSNYYDMFVPFKTIFSE